MMTLPVTLLLLLMPCVLALPWSDMLPARHTEMEQKARKPLDDLFNGFKLTYNKAYEDEYEEATRRAIFASNLERIRDHNELYDNGTKTFYLGINQFADMTNQEFRHYNGFRGFYRNGTNNDCAAFLSPANTVLPKQVDWRTKGYVTPVKNQGQCGSCWAFSATGSLEGQHFKKKGSLVSLSEQQLVDCSGSYGNNACNGGLMDNAFRYIKANGGIDGEADYQYEAKKGTCRYSPADMKATCTGCVDVRTGSETQLQQAVASQGPVSIAIDANHVSFQFYSGGVYNEPDCSSTQLDHGVLVVGYGTNKGIDYWLVKNSWGPAWGNDGYIMMSRNQDNQCGVATQASYPLV